MVDVWFTFPVDRFTKIDGVLMVDEVHEDCIDFVNLLFLEGGFWLKTKRGTHTFLLY